MNWLEEIKWNEEGLIPAVAQDEDTGVVLMLAWMNREALQRTLREGRACYYSRSRGALWLKGETSGHYQAVRAVRLDCDKDSVLLIVRQTGAACHEEYFTCFHNLPPAADGEWRTTGAAGERPEPALGPALESLAALIAERRRERPPGAYTTYLFEQGLDKILKKVGEESAEVLIAAKNRAPAELRSETADLFYHILVLLEEQGMTLGEVAAELLQRRKS